MIELKMREAVQKDFEDNNKIGRRYIIDNLLNYMDVEKISEEDAFEKEEQRLKNLIKDNNNDRYEAQLQYLYRLKNAVFEN